MASNNPVGDGLLAVANTENPSSMIAASANGKGASTRRVAKAWTSVTHSSGPLASRVSQGMTGEDALTKYREAFSYSKNRLARTDRRELVRQLLDNQDRRAQLASAAGAGGGESSPRPGAPGGGGGGG
ncbi:Methionine--tRNA ligase, cytoplasmic, partial [Frankliniella fusca]